jgi:hypothetical protein
MHLHVVADQYPLADFGTEGPEDSYTKASGAIEPSKEKPIRQQPCSYPDRVAALVVPGSAESRQISTIGSWFSGVVEHLSKSTAGAPCLLVAATAIDKFLELRT